MNFSELVQEINVLPLIEGRLRAFVTLNVADRLIVRDIKVIDGVNGLFLAMPSRRWCDHCAVCSYKNPVNQRFCGGCGTRLDENRAPLADDTGRRLLYTDVAHPIDQESRAELEELVLKEYHRCKGASDVDRACEDLRVPALP